MPHKQETQPPRDSFYFYMLERKKELENQGYKFPGGMKDVASAVGAEWEAMTPEEKMPYEEEARKANEEGKIDLGER